MKRIIIIIIGALTFTCCWSQPNPGFENWSSQFGMLEPDGWQTLNFLTLLTPPNPLSAFRVSGVDVHSGNYALKLKTVYLNNKPSAVELPDTTGGATTSKIILTPTTNIEGFPYTSRPEKLQFWAKYSPVGNDEGRAAVMLKKSNGNGFDTVAFGLIYIGATPVYTLFEVPIDYKSEELPDTAVIAFGTSKNSLYARVNSTLFVDDLLFTGYVGINESKPIENNVCIFPNPAANEVNIAASVANADNVIITDISGKVQGRYELQSNSLVIDLNFYSSGIYFCEIRDKNNILLHRDKLGIIR